MYVYLDESGDTGLQFRRGGSSRYFTVALLLVDDPIPLHQAVHDLRQRLKLPEAREFKFGNTGHEYCVAFFQAVRPYVFTIHAHVVDKQVPDLFSVGQQGTRYQYLVGLILAQERDALRNRTLVIDESVQGKGARARLATALRRAMAAGSGDEERVVRDIIFHASGQDNLIQVADMAAGAVARANERGDDQYVRLLGRRLRIAYYPPKAPGGQPH